MDAPEPPDPRETAAAQATMNKETAITQAGLNMTNQKTPYGSLTYNQIGTWADGTPRYEATQALSPEQQELFNLSNQTQQNLGNIGVEQSGKIRDILNTPFEYNNQDAENWAYDLGSQRLDPRFAREEESLQTQLLNRGIRPGSEAYNREVERLSQSKNDAYNQLMLTGRSQGFNEALTERNQPINEITALLSGSQVQQPNFANTPNTGVAPTDYIGAVNNNYNAQAANHNAKMSGLFGLGSAGLGGWAMGGFG